MLFIANLSTANADIVHDYVPTGSKVVDFNDNYKN